MSTRKKKNIPHVHKPVECFSVEHFPETLPFDPFACPVVTPEQTSVVVPEQALVEAPEQASVAASDEEQDQILEYLDEDQE